MNNKKSLSFMKEMKNILRSRLMTAAAITAGMALAACQSDNEVETPQPAAQGTPCEIPAAISGETRATTMTGEGGTTELTSVFNTTDVVYVSYGGAVDAGTLAPTSDGAESTTLAGTLTGTSYGNGSTIRLLLSPQAITDPTNIRYDDQNGTQASMLAHTFATASVKIKEVSPSITTGEAEFAPIQPLFRMKLQLKDGDTDVTSSATDATLNIQSTHSLYCAYNLATQKWITPLGNTITFTGIDLSASDGVVYLAIPMSEGGTVNRLDFTVTAGGKTYRGYKDKSGGFSEGTYYYMNDVLTLTNKVLPTITNHNDKEPTYDSEYSRYNWDASTPADVTISGASLGYYFNFNGGGQVTLSNVNANTSGCSDDTKFISIFGNELVVNLEGDNYIYCPEATYCIYNWDMPMPLGTSSTGTLQLRCTDNSNSRKGFCSSSKVVPATGCTVTPPADDSYTDNGDGTYTWTWTVKKN